MNTVTPPIPAWAIAPQEFESAVPFLNEARDEARLQFIQLGFPTARNEEWKYTNVAPLAKIPFKCAEKVSAKKIYPAWGPRAVFVNGFADRAASQLGALPPGVRLESLDSAEPELLSIIKTHFNRHVAWKQEPFTALNTARFQNGVVLYVPKGVVVDTPIHLAFHSLAGEAAGAMSSFLRVLIVLEENASAEVIEDFTGDESIYFTNAVTEMALSQGSRLQHTRLQREGAHAFHVSSMGVCQERDSFFSSKIVSIGGNLARQDLDVRLVGQGAECQITGFFIGEKTQHLDTNLKVEHRTSHARSQQHMKGIVGDQATGVFEGQIFVDKDAQKTDAVQTSKNLLLSAEANVYTKPALEIYANDVKCSHGATVGELDPDAIFYLRARGISESEARSLLTHAFVNEIVTGFEYAPLREEIQHLVRAKLRNFVDGTQL